MESRESRKVPPSKAEPTISHAAEKAATLLRELQKRLPESGEPGEVSEGALIRELKSRVQAGRLDVAREPDEPGEPVPEEMERELADRFQRTSGELKLHGGLLNEIRGRVLDGVAERILRGWGMSDGRFGSIEDELIERLVGKVFEQLSSPRSVSLRESQEIPSDRRKLANGS